MQEFRVQGIAVVQGPCMRLSITHTRFLEARGPGAGRTHRLYIPQPFIPGPAT